MLRVRAVAATPNSLISFASPTNDPMDALPNEMLENILNYLTASDLVRFKSVCQSWKQKVDGGGAWQTLFERDFPRAYRALTSLNQTRSNQISDTIVWPRVFTELAPCDRCLSTKNIVLKGIGE